MTAVQSLMNSNLTKHDALAALLNEIKDILTTSSFYTEALTGSIANSNMLLADIKGQNANLLTKQDAQIALLTQIRDNGA